MFFWGLKQVKITHKPFSQNNKKLKQYSSLTVVTLFCCQNKENRREFFFSFLKNSGLPFNVVTVSICSSCFHGEHHRAFLNVSLSILIYFSAVDKGCFCHLPEWTPVPGGGPPHWELQHLEESLGSAVPHPLLQRDQRFK